MGCHCFRDIQPIPGWWFQSSFIFHFIYGMSSFPLTNSIMFQDGDIAPPTRYMTPWEIVGIMASWGTTKGYRLVAMGLENLSTEHEDVEQEKVELS